MKVAIKIINQSRVRQHFGECAGDYESDRCAWWVGEPGELYPASDPGGAKVIQAPVRHCGGSGWIHSPRAALRQSLAKSGHAINSLGWIAERSFGAIRNVHPLAVRRVILQYSRLARVRP